MLSIRLPDLIVIADIAPLGATISIKGAPPLPPDSRLSVVVVSEKTLVGMIKMGNIRNTIK
jgi:hypothetical protein